MATLTTARSTPPTAAREPLRRPDWLRLGGMAGFIAVLHLAGWGTLLLVVAPAHYHVGTAGGFCVGLGITAYAPGMRHAFDADHIAAIDNTTPKLMADRQRALPLRLCFSLRPSSVLF